MARRSDGSYEHGEYDGFNPKLHDMQRQKAARQPRSSPTTKSKPIVIPANIYASVKPMTPEQRRRFVGRLLLIAVCLAGFVSLVIFANDH